MKTVVCGTKFGRIYLAGLVAGAKHLPFELNGILAKGSQRSEDCAAAYGVPLYQAVTDIPDEVQCACVVVGSRVNGGAGGELAQALLARGMHVLQEHPLHHDELAACLRTARNHGVEYLLNTHYVHIEPVRRFLGAAAVLRDHGPVQFIDAACGIQVLYSLLDVLGRVLGGFRPWSIHGSLRAQDGEARPAGPFSTVHLVLGQVPVTLRVQNELDSSDPDNHAHLLHRVTVGYSAGTLTLVNTHGPLLWAPRAHLPQEAKRGARMAEAVADSLDEPSAVVLGPVQSPSYRTILDETWPSGVVRALHLLLRQIHTDGAAPKQDQYYLTLCKIWQAVTGELGYPMLESKQAPRPIPMGRLHEAVAQAEVAPWRG